MGRWILVSALMAWAGCAPGLRSAESGRAATRADQGGSVIVRVSEGVVVLADGTPAADDLRAAWEVAGVFELSPLFRTGGSRDPLLFQSLGLDRIYVVSSASSDLNAEAAGALAGMEEAAADAVGWGASVPSDAWFSQQWALDGTGKVDGAVPGVLIHAQEAWDVVTGDGTVTIAILDSGVNLTEPDIASNLWHNVDEIAGNGVDDDANGYVDDDVGFDFVSWDADPDDDNGHGSNVAGLAAASGNNATGFAGVCWDCRVMVLKDLDAFAYGFVSSWAEALVYAADEGAHVANMSTVAPVPLFALEDAVAYATGVGVSVVAAIGNDDANVLLWPAAYPEVIAVGASDGSDRRVTKAVGGAWGSNWGDHVDLLAPGVSMLGLDIDDGDYTNARSGTSMAAPLVAGTLGLLRTLDPLASRSSLERALILGTIDRVGEDTEDAVGWDPYYGAGRLDVAGAVASLLRWGDAPPGLRLGCDVVGPGEAMSCVVDDVPGMLFTRVRLADDESPGICPAELNGLCWDVVGNGARADVLAGADGSAAISRVVSLSRDLGEMGVAQAVVASGDASAVSNVVSLVLKGCGDGEIDGDEACDDGDADDTDGCTASCEAAYAPGFTSVAGGGHHACALDEAGSVLCWGLNDQGQTSAPGGAFTALSTGRYHSCAVDAAGLLTCWGRDLEGQTAAPAEDYVLVDAGWYHTCGVTSSADAVCWGRNDSGETDAPIGSVVDAQAGFGFSCGLGTDAFVSCWGTNDSGQLDATVEAVTAIAVGGSHTCGLRVSDGAAECWGWNDYGQASPPGGAFVEIAAGHSHTCALDATGGIACWGRDFYAQTQPPSGVFHGLSAGRYHTCALTEAGERVCWGANTDGQSAPECGDGVLQSPETCDDGNRLDGDACNAMCVG